MRHNSLTIIVLAGAITHNLLGCCISEKRQHRVSDLITLKHASSSNPCKDAEAAIKANDLKFIGLNGFRTMVPGVEPYWRAYEESAPLQVIPGTTDQYPNSEGRAYISATDYARVFNSIMLKYLRTGDESIDELFKD